MTSDESTDAVVLIISVEATPGRRDELVAAMHEILPDTLGFDGNESVEMVIDTESPDRLVLVEHWTSLEHYANYKAWRASSGTSVLGTDLVAAPPSTSICRRA